MVGWRCVGGGSPGVRVVGDGNRDAGLVTGLAAWRLPSGVSCLSVARGEVRGAELACSGGGHVGFGKLWRTRTMEDVDLGC